MRELILLVYLNDRYGFSKKLDVSKLKEFIGYSAGGLYNALDESGYFHRKGDEISLSDKGEKYAKRELMRQYRNLYPLSYVFIFLGIILTAHWYLLQYRDVLLFFDWAVGASLIVCGLIVRFMMPALTLWFLRIFKKV